MKKTEVAEIIANYVQTPEELYTNETALEYVLDAIRQMAEQHIPDVSTRAGRDAITANAYKVTRSKTFIDDIGKRLTDELKERQSRIKATRDLVKTRLDGLREKIKEPLAEWEKTEAHRVEKIQKVIEFMRQSAADAFKADSADEIRARAANLAEYKDYDFQEYQEAATDVLQWANLSVQHALENAERREEMFKRIAESEAARKQAEREAKQLRIEEKQKSLEQSIEEHAATPPVVETVIVDILPVQTENTETDATTAAVETILEQADNPEVKITITTEVYEKHFRSYYRRSTVEHILTLGVKLGLVKMP